MAGEGPFESTDDSEGRALEEVVPVVLEILLNSGPDAVHLSTIAQELGRPLGEVEETFGHPGELLYLAWNFRLRSEFEDLVRQTRELMSGDLGSLDSGLSTSPLRKAACHLLVVAHRYDELREVVPFDVQRLIQKYESDPKDIVDRSVLRALIGWLLGIALEPGHRYGDSLKLLRYIGWRDGVCRDVQLGERVERTPPLSLTFDDEGDLAQEILGACTRIVAQGGFGRATLFRIARHAGYPPEVLHGLYGRQEYLIAQYIRSVFALLFSFPRFTEFMSSPAIGSMRLTVWLESDMHIRRRAVLESVIASNFSPLLESAFVDAAEGALADMRIAYLDVSEEYLAISQTRFLASRQVALGLALLEDIEVEGWIPDWNPFLHVFLSNPN